MERTDAPDGESAFEVGARYRTRIAIDALRDRFAAGEVLVYWRFGSSHYDDARGWFFREPGSAVIRSYDLLGGERLRRDELFERVAGPPPVLAAVVANDTPAVAQALAVGTPDPDAILDRELAAEQALVLDRPEAAAVLIARGGLDYDARLRLLEVAARRGRARAIGELLATGVAPDAALPGHQTALVAAVFGAHVDAIRTLVAAGADPDGLQPNGGTARDFARSPEVVALLGPPPTLR